MNNNNIYHYKESLSVSFFLNHFKDFVQHNKENINFFNQNESNGVGDNLKKDHESNSDMNIYSKDPRNMNEDGFKVKTP